MADPAVTPSPSASPSKEDQVRWEVFGPKGKARFDELVQKAVPGLRMPTRDEMTERKPPTSSPGAVHFGSSLNEALNANPAMKAELERMLKDGSIPPAGREPSGSPNKMQRESSAIEAAREAARKAAGK